MNSHGLAVNTSGHSSSGMRSDAGPSSASSPKPTVNPLMDLIRTEQAYVDELASIIKRVAGAWSRSNFPPPALDKMFRAVEAVYRINKSLLSQLNQIGPSPASPKALGDLLMRWIDELEPAYTRYATDFATDFDTWVPVQSNPNLARVLDATPWPTTLSSVSSQAFSPISPGFSPEIKYGKRTSIDALFCMPLYRLRYYKKLYAKLLRSTQEGRQDHVLLTLANEKLDRLLRSAEAVQDRSVAALSSSGGSTGSGSGAGGTAMAPSSSQNGMSRSNTLPPVPPLADPPIPPQQQPPAPPRSGGLPSREGSISNINAGTPNWAPPRRTASKAGHQPPSASSSSAPDRGSDESSRLGGSSSGGDRFSGTSDQTYTSRSTLPGSLVLPPPPRLDELERRLNTDRVLDIFTMQPKKCKLQIAPPSLPFTRAMRRTGDVQITFIPLSDPARRQVVLRRAFIVLLTDLFLVCEHMTTEERAQHAAVDGSDMWLVYPPLAGKHLKVQEGQQEGEIEVTVMRKEVLTIRSESRTAAAEWRAAFEDAIMFAASSAQMRSDSISTSRSVPSPTADSFSSSSLQRPTRNGSLSYNTSPSSYSDPRFGGPPPNMGGSMGDAPLPPVPPPGSLNSLRSQRGLGSLGSGSNSPQNASLPPPPRKASMNSRPAGGDASRAVSTSSSASFSNSTPPYHSPNPINTNLGGSDMASRSGSSLGHNSNPPTPRSPFGPSSGGQFPSRSGSGLNLSAPPLSKSNSSRSNGSLSDGGGYGQQYGPPYGSLPAGGSIPTSRRTDPGSSYPAENGLLTPGNSVHRSRSHEGLRGDQYAPPSRALRDNRSQSAGTYGYDGPGPDDSPPPSPVEKLKDTTVITAQMRCKVFLQNGPSNWKSLGTAKLKLYVTSPSNIKQLVVESDKDKKTMVSTIVLTDGVERVGKTGVAIELSNEGLRTGIIHMLQMKTEQAATGLFDQLLMGSNRARASQIA